MKILKIFFNAGTPPANESGEQTGKKKIRIFNILFYINFLYNNRNNIREHFIQSVLNNVSY